MVGSQIALPSDMAQTITDQLRSPLAHEHVGRAKQGARLEV
jgi:hypothetical protein